jgi:hypothetical protein
MDSKELLNSLLNTIDELQMELVDENIDVWQFYYEMLEMRDYIKANLEQ